MRLEVYFISMRMNGLILLSLVILALLFCPAYAADKGVFTGQVTWAVNNSAVSDAKVCIQRPDHSIAGVTNTNPQGRFRIELPAGRYIISTEKDNFIKEYYGNEYFFAEADPVQLYGGEVRHLNISLEYGGWVSGNFSYCGDDIVTGLLTAVKIDDPYSGWHKSQQLTGPYPSAYSISGLIPGTYKIMARARGKATEYYPGVQDPEEALLVTVEEASGESDISFDLDQVGWGSIQGRIYNSQNGQGVPNIKVYVFQWREYLEDPSYDSTITDASGAYLFNLNAGRYYIMARYIDDFQTGQTVTMYYFGHYNIDQAQVINLAEGQDIADINFPLELTIAHDLTISGSVIHQVSGMGVDDVVISAIDYETGEIIGTGMSFDDGQFEIPGLSPRRYLLMFSGSNIVPFFYYRSFSWQDANVITLDMDFRDIQTEAITQDYGDDGLAIMGRITYNNAPVAGARLYAYRNGQADPAAHAISDAYGEYTIMGGLATGQYSIMCDIFGFEREYYPMPIFLDLLTNPTVDDINFELTPIITSTMSGETPRVENALAGNYPNPFNSRTIISFYSGRNDRYEAGFYVYNLLGQVVGKKTIDVIPGYNSLAWDMADFTGSVSSGVYYYKIDGLGGAGRMLLLK